MPISNPAPRPINVEVIQSTRVKDAASGDASYTGVGFLPTAVIAIAPSYGNAALGQWSLGFATGITTHQGCMFADNTNTQIAPNPNCFVEAITGAAYQTAVWKSWDSDGFTLTWTKGGAGSSWDITLYFMAIG